MKYNAIAIEIDGKQLYIPTSESNLHILEPLGIEKLRRLLYERNLDIEINEGRLSVYITIHNKENIDIVYLFNENNEIIRLSDIVYTARMIDSNQNRYIRNILRATFIKYYMEVYDELLGDAVVATCIHICAI